MHRSFARYSTAPMRAALFFAFALPALGACRATPPAEAPASETPVAVARATSATLVDEVIVTGTFASRDEIPLSFKTGGVVARVLVDQGESVRRGQTLATLDAREIDAMVAKATAAFEKAERDEARVRRLHDDSVTTRAQWQDAVSALTVARADLAAVRVNRGYASIVAPEDGVIMQRIATAGSTVAPGMPVLLLGGERRGRVLRAALSDRDALRVSTGDRARIRFDALPDTEFRGTVTLLGRAADARTGTYTVEIRLDATADDGGRAASALPAGLVGEARIAPRGGDTRTTVPVEALVDADDDSATVFAIGNPTDTSSAPIAVPHRVGIVALHGDRVSVSGLAAGTSVITRGAPYVTPGARVRITERAP